MSSEDFKSFCRALIPSGVGSIPTRSRHVLLRPAVTAALLVALVSGPAGAAAAPEAAGPEPFRPSPKGALIRSTVLPGWGQLYNRRWIKGVLFAAGRIYLGARAVEEHRLANDLEAEAFALDDEAVRNRRWREHNRALARRDDFIWYSAYALLFTMAEAFVDAALMEFDDEMKEADGLGATSAPIVRVGFEVGF